MKPEIILKNVNVTIPILNSSSVSLKKLLVSQVLPKIDINSSLVHVTALKNINLEIYDGDRVGILGNNGAGKTTLLRLISGAYKPTIGSRKVNGSIVSLIDIQSGLNLEATGYENIIYRGILLGKNKKEILQKIDEIVDFSELKEFIHLPTSTYSTGMLIRLGFSILTSFESDILIMDEWLSVGDTNYRVKAKKRLTEYINNSKIVIMASHDTKILKSFCNKLYNIEGGELFSYKKNKV